MSINFDNNGSPLIENETFRRSNSALMLYRRKDSQFRTPAQEKSMLNSSRSIDEQTSIEEK